MPFTKTTWVDGNEPAITATQLNRIEAGIEDAHAGDLDAASIDTAVLVDKAVTNGKFRDSVGPSVVGRAASSTGSVADISAGSDGQVLRRAGGALAFGTVATAGIGDLQVTTGKLAAGAVTTAKIGDAEVTNAKIASGVDAGKLTTGTLPIARIADGAISTAKIGDGQVTTAKIGDSQVTTAKIGDAQVATAKIGNTQVTNAKLASDLDASKLTAGTLPIARIADGDITNAKLAADGFDAGKLTVGTLPIARIAANAVGNDKIRQSAALSVVGRSANSDGNVADILAATDGHVLRRSGTSIGFGTIVNAATTATASNTANAIVARDASGNFAANAITAAANSSFNGIIVGRSANNNAVSTAVGASALDAATTGVANTAVGANTLSSLASGGVNTAVGTNALKTLTTGNFNTAVGGDAMDDCGTGAGANTVVGAQAARKVTGVDNTFIGVAVAEFATSADRNTAVGANALFSLTTGNNNIAIGQNSGTTSINVAPPTGLQNITNQSNKIIMGNFLHNEAFIKIAWTVTSDKRDKTEFKPIKHGLDFVTKLKPTEYQFKLDNRDGDGDGIRRYGFNAQDILKLEGKDPVIINASNAEHLTYNESHLIPVLVRAIQELKLQVDELKAACQCAVKE